MTAQKSAELLAKSEARAAQRHVIADRAAAINQFERALDLAEARHLEHQLAARFALDGDDTADEVAAVIEGLDLNAGAARGDHEIIGCDCQPLFAGLAKHRFEAGGEKTLNRFQDLRHCWCAKAPRRRSRAGGSAID